jgi:hypothetical protein
MLLATCCEDDIVPFVLPFVKDNIKSADWRFRDAALMAFGKMWLLWTWDITAYCDYNFVQFFFCFNWKT